VKKDVNSIKVLGIDPGTINCGYAILEIVNKKIKICESGVIKIKSRVLQVQILELVEALDLIFDTHEITEVSIEDMFFAHNPKSVIKLAQFRGALSLKILQEFGNFAEYTPLQVKKGITGNGKSSKEQVAYMVKKILGIKEDIKSLDMTDAIAVAYIHCQNVKSKY
jgi:crossover junction endodeoxyribonuclease RuvC